ncbi:N-terminal phage integrase SAM-like domain-containing protein [Nonomuraea sp. PA05]|uniref:N-terminal phage integrase SAM-like domain-containing protein n=1 Tax=Nonomuraea sp. PA05 TaxID=2604466 RepID=UPI0021CD12F6|nr:N-terminal phage integrase SAM-like domain-containing protein [Nonomuraea sp. PA05]
MKGLEKSAGTFSNKKTADKAWQNAESKVAEGRLEDPGRGRQTFKRYVLEPWLPNHEIEATTRQSYTYVIHKHLIPEFGEMRMIGILPEHVREWVAALKKMSSRLYCGDMAVSLTVLPGGSGAMAYSPFSLVTISVWRLSTAVLITVTSPRATPAMMAVMITHSTADAPRLGTVRACRIRMLRNACKRTTEGRFMTIQHLAKLIDYLKLASLIRENQETGERMVGRTCTVTTMLAGALALAPAAYAGTAAGWQTSSGDGKVTVPPDRSTVKVCDAKTGGRVYKAVWMNDNKLDARGPFEVRAPQGGCKTDSSVLGDVWVFRPAGGIWMPTGTWSGTSAGRRCGPSPV